MSYVLKPRSFNKVQKFLDAIVESPDKIITFTLGDSGKPSTFAYYLRQGIAYAQHAKLEPYSLLDISIKTEANTVIITKRNDLGFDIVDISGKSVKDGLPKEIEDIKTFNEAMTFLEDNPIGKFKFPSIVYANALEEEVLLNLLKDR